jgi:hypothetical protein
MKKIALCVLTFLLIAGFSSCKKDNGVQLVVFADSFIKSVNSANSQVKYGLISYISASKSMTSVGLTGPSTQNLPMNKYNNEGTSYTLETDTSLYTTVPPAAGIYSFNAKFADGTEQVLTNNLTSSVIAPPVITSLALATDKQSVIVKWNAVTAAQAYSIRITKGGTEVYTYPPFADNTGNSTLQAGIPISVFSGGIPGTFDIEVVSLLYESTQYDLLQAEGSSTQSVTITN